MAAKSATLSSISKMIADGQETLRKDFEAKHKENVDRRHFLGGEISRVENQQHVLDGRIGALERDMRTVVGDNTGGSGLLHSIDKKVDQLQSDFAALKTGMQDAPAIRKWVYGAAAVAGFLAVIVAPVVAFSIFVLKLLLKH
jgi:hypothetical protein